MTAAAQVVFPADDRLARRNALLLALAQAIGGSSASIVIALGGLAGYALLGSDKSLATLPVTFFVLGTACGTLPAGFTARRFGRRLAYMSASTLAAASGVIACWAILENNFGLLLTGTLGAGFAGAFVQSYRFAAADTASEAFKPKAISWVMAGGVLAGVIGPQTVIFTKDLFAPTLFAGSFAALALLNVLAIGILAFISIPRLSTAEQAQSGRPIWAIMRQRRFVVAAACGISSYALMSFVMTATPLAMVQSGLSHTHAALGIQWHVLAMFAPSFFTGHLIVRFGKERIVAVGLVLLCGSGLTALAGIELEKFWAALILLGLGWNFGFIGATAMVTDTYQSAERNKVQATNDFLVFGFVALASFSSGNVLNDFGWEAINWLIFPVVLACAGMLAWLVWSERSRPAGSA